MCSSILPFHSTHRGMHRWLLMLAFSCCQCGKLRHVTAVPSVVLLQTESLLVSVALYCELKGL